MNASAIAMCPPPVPPPDHVSDLEGQPAPAETRNDDKVEVPENKYYA